MIQAPGSKAAATHEQEWEQLEEQFEFAAVKAHVLEDQGGWRAIVTVRKDDFKYVVCFSVHVSAIAARSAICCHNSNG
jgi:hypothetical protein